MNPEAPVVLAVFAQSSDAEIEVGGLLALLASRGWQVVFADATAGDLSGPEGTRRANAKRRLEEARRAAAQIGAIRVLLGEEEGFVFDDRSLREALVRLFRTHRPTVVITAGLDAEDSDNRALASAVSVAADLARCEAFALGGAPLTQKIALYVPARETWFDVSAGHRARLAMLQEYRSRAEGFQKNETSEVWTSHVSRSAAAALPFGWEAAEGLRLLTGKGLSEEPRLSRELADFLAPSPTAIPKISAKNLKTPTKSAVKKTR